MKTKYWLILFLLLFCTALSIIPFFYYSSHPNTFYHQSLNHVSRRIPHITRLVQSSLKVIDPLLYFYRDYFGKEKAIRISVEQFKLLEELTRRLENREIIQVSEMGKFKPVISLLENDKKWMPEEKNGAKSWLEAIARLQRLKQKAKVAMIELQRDWVSVLITIESVNGTPYWTIDFINEVLYPTSIESLALKAKSGDQFILADSSTGKLTVDFQIEKNGEYVFSDKPGLMPERYILTGEIENIIGFKVKLKNHLTGKVFEPRAIRWLDYTEDK